jgi:DNA-binding FrmR family transcriptional regulator
MRHITTHQEQIVALKRIEGQVRGLQNMIEEGKYCVDILNQVQSVIAALARVQDKILEKHINSCVVNAVKGKSESEKDKKLNELLQLVSRFRKTSR